MHNPSCKSLAGAKVRVLQLIPNTLTNKPPNSPSGQGLGKASDGIVKPIKATFKFDNTGLGHDAAASDFNNHWWERVYNDAASNLKVSKEGSGGKTQIQIRDDEGVDISTSSINYKKMKKKHGKMAGFGTFIKTATLTNTGTEAAVEEQVDLEEFRHDTVKPLTDEELFAACGGRTAHKGARHGLKLSGKLARMAEQDAKLMQKFNPQPSTSKSPAVVDEEDPELQSMLYQAEYTKKLSKRKKKTLQRIDNDLSESLDSFSLQSPTKETEDEKFHRLNDQHGGSIQKKKRKKCKKLKEKISTILDEIRGSKSDEEVPATKKNKSSKKSSLKKYKSDEELNVVQQMEKKSKKKREKIFIEPQDDDLDGDMSVEAETDVTELEDSMVGDQGKLSARKKRLSKEMKPKRKRNRDQKAEKKLARALAASLTVAEEDEDAIDEDL